MVNSTKHYLTGIKATNVNDQYFMDDFYAKLNNNQNKEIVVNIYSFCSSFKI